MQNRERSIQVRREYCRNGACGSVFIVSTSCQNSRRTERTDALRLLLEICHPSIHPSIHICIPFFRRRQRSLRTSRSTPSNTAKCLRLRRPKSRIFRNRTSHDVTLSITRLAASFFIGGQLSQRLHQTVGNILQGHAVVDGIQCRLCWRWNSYGTRLDDSSPCDHVTVLSKDQLQIRIQTWQH